MITPVEYGSTSSWRAVQQAGHRHALGVRVREAGLTRARIRVARVDDERTHAATGLVLAREMVAAHRHRRGAEAVAREYACGDGAGLAHDEQHVVALPLLDLRRCGAEHDARNRQQRLGRGRRVADGH
jgi:hypothetical protein